MIHRLRAERLACSLQASTKHRRRTMERDERFHFGKGTAERRGGNPGTVGPHARPLIIGGSRPAIATRFRLDAALADTDNAAAAAAAAAAAFVIVDHAHLRQPGPATHCGGRPRPVVPPLVP